MRRAGQLERHEIPDPVRSDAVEALFQYVRQASGSGPERRIAARARRRPGPRSGLGEIPSHTGQVSAIQR